METTTTLMRFRLQACERCGRETIQAVRDDYGICSGCEPAAFERAAVEAGPSEFLR